HSVKSPASEGPWSFRLQIGTDNSAGGNGLFYERKGVRVTVNRGNYEFVGECLIKGAAMATIPGCKIKNCGLI
ncbi:MAG: hypothetical protein VW707_10010, partial [Candidatus Puniceispirillum sp.]